MDVIKRLKSGAEIIAIPAPPLFTNCYLIIKDGACVIIDPAASENIILKAAKNKGAEICAALLTHGHFDHYGSAAALKRKNIPVYMGEADFPIIGKTFFHRLVAPESFTPDAFVVHNQVLNFKGITLKVIFTPGHSPGGVSYLFEEALFSGDTLFYGDIGRSDLPGGCHKTLIKSIRSRLFNLPADTLVLPGHGEFSTIGDEKNRGMDV